MKILVISHALHEKNKQEVDPYCKLSKAGLDIYFAYRGGLLPEEIDAEGCVKLVRLEGNAISVMREMLRLVEREGIRFVMNSTSSVKNLLYVFVLSRLCSVIPVIRIEADTPTAAIYQEKRRVLKVVKRLAYPVVWRMCLSNAKGVIALSRYLRNLALSYGAKRVAEVSQGVDTDLFDPEKIEKKYDLIYVGRISREKNLPMLFRVFEKLKKGFPRLTLCIVGDGPERAALEKEYGGEGVTFAGYVEHENLPEYYGAARVFVLTSLSEGLPTVIMEAMACRLPVVSTNVGGVFEIVVDGKTGFVVDDEETFEEKLSLLLNSPALERKFGLRAAERIRRLHSIEAISEKYKKFFANLLKE